MELTRLDRTAQDYARVRAVLMAAPAYSLLATGRLPDETDVRALVEDLPSGCTFDDKFVFGISHEGKLVGVLDLVLGYPAPATAFLGLLILDEAHRGQGLGAGAARAAVEFAREHAMERVRLAVIEANAPALGFWQKVGFSATGEHTPYEAGSVVSSLILMERAVGAHGPVKHG